MKYINLIVIYLSFLSCNNTSNEKIVFETNDETIQTLDGSWINENSHEDTLHLLHQQYDNGRINEGKYKNRLMSWEVIEPGECEINFSYPGNLYRGPYKVKLINRERLSIENDVYVKIK
jgi:hypothetical protein